MNPTQIQTTVIVGIVTFFLVLTLIIILLLLPGMFYKVMQFLFSEAA